MRPIARHLSLLCLLFLKGCDLANNGDSNVEIAARLKHERKFAEAIPYLEKALEQELVAFKRSTILVVTGNCYVELEDFDKSISYFDLALKEDPNFFKAYVSKGIVFRKLGNYDRATEMYEKALELKPDYAELHASMGALALLKSNYDQAIKHLEHAIELDDALAVAHSNLAVAYATVGRFDEADNELKKAVIRGYHQPEIVQQRIDNLRAMAEKAKTSPTEK